MAASVSDIFCVAQEIASKGIVKNGITSVGDSLYNIVSDRAKDVLAPHGIILTDGRYPIQVKQLRNCAPESAHSAVWAYKDHAVIEIAAKNTCWTRMAYAKELAHIYMGFVDGEYGSLNMLLTAARTARQNLPEHNNEKIPNDEMFCFYLAMELMIPWGELRNEAMEMHERNRTNYEIAKRFKVPEWIVSHFFDGEWTRRSWDGNRAV